MSLIACFLCAQSTCSCWNVNENISVSIIHIIFWRKCTSITEQNVPISSSLINWCCLKLDLDLCTLCSHLVPQTELVCQQKVICANLKATSNHFDCQAVYCVSTCVSDLMSPSCFYPEPLSLKLKSLRIAFLLQRTDFTPLHTAELPFQLL